MSNQDDLRRTVKSAYEIGPDFPHPALLARISTDLKSGATPGRQVSWIAGAVSAALAVAIVFAFIGFLRPANPTPHQPGASPATGPASPSPSTIPSPSSPLAISSAAFHDGEVGVAYGQVSLSASGGTPPYTWTVSQGTLPGGLALDPGGTVSGAPTAAGPASFTVQVTDASGTTAQASASSFKIAPALTAGYLPACAGGNCVAEVGCVPCLAAKAFGYVNGGLPPYSFSVTAGMLPPGTVLSGMALDGSFDGTGGTYNFEVTVTDGIGGRVTLNPTFRVAARLWINGSFTCEGDYNTGCSVRLPYSGGVGTPGASASEYASPNLPPGFSVVVSGGAVIVTFPKDMVNGWKGIVYVQIADAYTTTAMSPREVDVTVLPR